MNNQENTPFKGDENQIRKWYSFYQERVIENRRILDSVLGKEKKSDNDKAVIKDLTSELSNDAFLQQALKGAADQFVLSEIRKGINVDSTENSGIEEVSQAVEPGKATMKVVKDSNNGKEVDVSGGTGSKPASSEINPSDKAAENPEKGSIDNDSAENEGGSSDSSNGAANPSQKANGSEAVGAVDKKNSSGDNKKSTGKASIAERSEAERTFKGFVFSEKECSDINRIYTTKKDARPITGEITDEMRKNAAIIISMVDKVDDKGKTIFESKKILQTKDGKTLFEEDGVTPLVKNVETPIKVEEAHYGSNKEHAYNLFVKMIARKGMDVENINRTFVRSSVGSIFSRARRISHENEVKGIKIALKGIFPKGYSRSSVTKVPNADAIIAKSGSYIKDGEFDIQLLFSDKDTVREEDNILCKMIQLCSAGRYLDATKVAKLSLSKIFPIFQNPTACNIVTSMLMLEENDPYQELDAAIGELIHKGHVDTEDHLAYLDVIKEFLQCYSKKFVTTKTDTGETVKEQFWSEEKINNRINYQILQYVDGQVLPADAKLATPNLSISEYRAQVEGEEAPECPSENQVEGGDNSGQEVPLEKELKDSDIDQLVELAKQMKIEIPESYAKMGPVGYKESMVSLIMKATNPADAKKPAEAQKDGDKGIVDKVIEAGKSVVDKVLGKNNKDAKKVTSKKETPKAPSSTEAESEAPAKTEDKKSDKTDKTPAKEEPAEPTKGKTGEEFEIELFYSANAQRSVFEVKDETSDFFEKNVRSTANASLADVVSKKFAAYLKKMLKDQKKAKNNKTYVAAKVPAGFENYSIGKKVSITLTERSA